MRASALLLACAAIAGLTGCKAEPDFDERFEQRSRELREKAKKIEADADARLAAAREAERAAAELETADPTNRP